MTENITPIGAGKQRAAAPSGPVLVAIGEDTVRIDPPEHPNGSYRLTIVRADFFNYEGVLEMAGESFEHHISSKDFPPLVQAFIAAGERK